MTQLVCIVPDSPYEGLLMAIHEQRVGLRIGHYDQLVVRHPQKEPGVYKTAADTARARRGWPQAKYGIALLDYLGTNTKKRPAEIETEIESAFSKNTFKDCCAAICVEPELERLYLNETESLSNTLRITNDRAVQLIAEGRNLYPDGPEEQMIHVLSMARRLNGRKLSFREIVNETNYATWNEQAEGFQKLIATLRQWFPRS